MRLLRGLGGRVLPCGCLVGIYETYEGSVVSTIDAKGPNCPDAGHRRREPLPSDIYEDVVLSGEPPRRS